MNDKKPIHIHKLKRLRYKSGNAIFFCVLPDCKFKASIPLSLGKRSTCWRCGNEFIMNDYSLRLAKPHCEACHQSKDSKAEFKEEELYIHTDAMPPGVECPSPLTLSERLQQVIQKKQEEQEDEI